MSRKPLPSESKMATYGVYATCTDVQEDAARLLEEVIEYGWRIEATEQALPTYILRQIHMRQQAINAAIATHGCPEHEAELIKIYRKLVIRIDDLMVQQENLEEEPIEE
jgi:hypothetical protein